jgi:hypothetical protein
LDGKIFTEAKLITENVSFLLQNFKKKSHIYQGISGDIMIIVDEKIFVMNYALMHLCKLHTF